MPQLQKYELYRPVPKIFRIKEAAAKIYAFEVKTGIVLSQSQIDEMSMLMMSKGFKVVK